MANARMSSRTTHARSTKPGQLYNAEWGGIQLSLPTNAVFGSGPLAKIALALIADDD
jgi:hypothetical protein